MIRDGVMRSFYYTMEIYLSSFVGYNAPRVPFHCMIVSLTKFFTRFASRFSSGFFLFLRQSCFKGVLIEFFSDVKPMLDNF